MKIALLLVTVLLAACRSTPAPEASAAPAAASTTSSRAFRLADVAFLAGHWGGEERGTRTEEAWLAPAGGVMLGVNRTLPASGRASFEYLRIEQRGDAVVYVASPGGRGATEFTLVSAGERFAQFENPAHDFPQRIRYELDAAGALHARVSGGTGGHAQALEWTWQRQPPAGR